MCKEKDEMWQVMGILTYAATHTCLVVCDDL